MRILFRQIFKFAPALLFMVTAHVVTTAQTAKLQLDQLDVLSNRASETVDVKLDEHLLQMTAKASRSTRKMNIRLPKSIRSWRSCVEADGAKSSASPAKRMATMSTFIC
jgi:predicted RecB family endonuclease